MHKRILAGTAAILLTGMVAAGAYAATPAPAAPNAAEMQKKQENRCADRTARMTGRLAYLEAKLKPTAEQRAAWANWRDSVMANAKAREQQCLQMPARTEKKRLSIVERQAMLETTLAARLEALRASRPALEALYKTLDDNQKKILDRAGDLENGRFGHGKDMRAHRFEQRRGGWNAPARGSDAPAPATQQ
ncbi:MAG: Spy/CpxP family protein refolding chaperone [Parvibaculum sp.]|uniref:Spy/CpxP family protein refolding chaperone n=1 Tax=Parvibaculum sp. TaxID=2024848 RepID=UPI003C78C24C